MLLFSNPRAHGDYLFSTDSDNGTTLVALAKQSKNPGEGSSGDENIPLSRLQKASAESSKDKHLHKSLKAAPLLQCFLPH